MITHVVMMKFKDGVSDSDIDELERMFDGLPERIVEILSYDFGRDIVRSERSYDFALVSIFANLETLRQYQTHPAHLEVVKQLTAMCERILVVDYEAGKLPRISKADDVADDPWESDNLFRPA